MSLFQIPGNEEEDNGGTASSPEEELARRFKDVMRRIFWDRFTQSLMPPPDPSIATASAGATSPSDSSAAAGTAAVTAAAGGSSDGDGGVDEKEVAVDVPGLPSLRVGSKVHSRYGSERGSYYVATVLAVVKKTAAAGGEEGGGGGVFVDVRYDEDGMVERAVPVSRLKKKNDPPDFGPLLALLGEVRTRVPCVCSFTCVCSQLGGIYTGHAVQDFRGIHGMTLW